VELLLANKADYTILDAIAGDELEKVKAFIKDDPKLLSDKDAFLREAAVHGRQDVAEWLLQNKADINSKDTAIGFSPLHLAIMGGHGDVAQWLVSRGADANAADFDSRTVLQFAVQGGQKDLVKLLLVKKAEVNAKDNIGTTALHLAAIVGATDIMKLLLTAKAEVNPTNKFGWTPLHFAVDRNNKEVAELLRQHGGTNDLRPPPPHLGDPLP
jgi:ankyrin repeat protein